VQYSTALTQETGVRVRIDCLARHCAGIFLPGGLKMDRQQAIERLKEQQGSGDTENAHINADEVLCQLLEHLGYADVVAEYNKIDMWYA